MATFTAELYSAALGRDVELFVTVPSSEAARGEPAVRAEFPGLWLLTRPGGLPTDWYRYTRHLPLAEDRFLCISPPDGEGEAYERFLTQEVPAYLSGFGLKREGGLICAHPESAARAEQLAAKHPDLFSAVIPQEAGDGGWKQADDSLTAFLIKG